MTMTTLFYPREILSPVIAQYALLSSKSVLIYSVVLAFQFPGITRAFLTEGLNFFKALPKSPISV